MYLCITVIIRLQTALGRHLNTFTITSTVQCTISSAVDDRAMLFAELIDCHLFSSWNNEVRSELKNTMKIMTREELKKSILSLLLKAKI